MAVKFFVLQLYIREFRSFKTNFGWIAETPSRPAKFTVLRVWYLLARTSFLENRFSAKFFEMHKFKIFLLKLVGCLVAWSPVLTLNPKILGSIPKQLKKKRKKPHEIYGVRCSRPERPRNPCWDFVYRIQKRHLKRSFGFDFEEVY
jgi:hypothetical protein